MGNTPSSPSKLRRDSSLISGPRALGLRGSRTTAPSLGPEFIISPYPSPSPNQSQVSFQNSLNSRRSTLDAPRARHSIEASDVRRTRSANASPGPSREERSLELLNGAPPPYTSVYIDDPLSSNFKHPATRDGHLAVPGSSHQAKGHRRAVSSVTPGEGSTTHAGVRPNSLTIEEAQSTALPESRMKPLPEVFGYGIGSGQKVDLNYTTPYADSDAMTPATASSSPEITRSTSSASSSTENPLELLRRYNTVFIVDDSSSMAGERWTEAREALASLADTAARYDMNGIDVHFLNSNRSAQNMRSASSVKRQFDSIQPNGLSMLAQKLEELLQSYLSTLDSAKQDVSRGDLRAVQRVKPVNYIIITDGVPTDDPETVIVQAARRLDNGNFPVSQVGIQFVQIGNDPRATEALRELDDGLAKEYGIRDMVDFTPYVGGPLDSETLVKILLGGMNRRVDKKGARSIMS
ncbi:hypothetical protein M0805_006102 [Coniferiporia weirii]|nr:hypothetical protein M0805_006102 [Coniferiporia weirii]